MSTIKTIQGTDEPKNSRTDINDNFAALNADKVGGAANLNTPTKIPFVSAPGTLSESQISTNAGNLFVDNVFANGDGFEFTVLGVPLWVIYKNSGAGRIELERFDALGSYVDSPWAVNGTTGQMTINSLLIGSAAPANAAATGVAGTITWDASYIYVCVSQNVWKRVAIATW